MENILTWKDELATGFADVDLQHKKLILIINDIHVAMNEPETLPNQSSITASSALVPASRRNPFAK